ncbi:MAG: alpha/beta hydrolase [Deltaproteobacteria bacterium]|nr:alpha/beta hydrolase [Deltaproteobacteria bacterium]
MGSRNDGAFDPRSLKPNREGLLCVDDGTTLPWQEFGAGPAVVLANGIGVRWPGLAHQISVLRDRRRVVCWDYRGMGPSRLGRPDADVSMGRQADDVLALMNHMGIERAILGGWSMGVQVSLEVLRRRPERVAGFVALLGTYGRPFRGAFPAPVAAVTEATFALALRFPALAQRPLDLAVALPGLAFRVLSGAVFVGADADRRVFDGNVRWVQQTDRRVYLRTMLELARHDASDVLPGVRCPSLIVCGARDHLTPPRVARRMAETIPGAEYLELAGATHFGLIEQQQTLDARLVAFVDRVWGGP